MEMKTVIGGLSALTLVAMVAVGGSNIARADSDDGPGYGPGSNWMGPGMMYRGYGPAWRGRSSGDNQSYPDRRGDNRGYGRGYGPGPGMMYGGYGPGGCWGW